MKVCGARGSYLYDEMGNEWLDMLSGILNVSLGHGSLPVRQALNDVEANGLLNSYDRPALAAEQLRAKLGEYMPGFTWKLLNTGAEAIERAIQVAALHLGRRPIVAVLPGSFHGKSLSMAGIRYDVEWGNPMGVIELDLHPDAPKQHFDVLVYEPVSGWDGTWNSPVKMRKICDARGALLIADEMITGFGRCGDRFLSRNADMIVSGKGLAQGAPLSVLGVSKKLNDKISIGWNTTGGGNNLCASIALNVLDYLMRYEDELSNRLLRIENFLRQYRFGRVYGALAFRDLTLPAASVRSVFEREHVVASWHGNVLRLGPNFYTTDEQLETLRTVMIKAGEWE